MIFITIKSIFMDFFSAIRASSIACYPFFETFNMKNMFATAIQDCDFEILMIFEIFHSNSTLPNLGITLCLIISSCFLINELLHLLQEPLTDVVDAIR